MPWIDPLKEGNAWEKLVQAGFSSEVEVIRRRGGNPREVQGQLQQYREEAALRGLQMSSNPANKSSRSEDKNFDERYPEEQQDLPESMP